jgi:uncharacterized membrane protein
MKKKELNVHVLAEMAVLVAIILLMAFTPLGYMPTPWGIQITLIVIPVAVGSIILGPKAGAFLGLVFGLTSFANAFSNAMGMMFLEVSVLRTMILLIGNRVLVGLIPGLLFQAFKGSPKMRTIGTVICCFLTPVTNTVLYIVGNWLMFKDTWLGSSLTADYSGDGGISLLGFMLAMVAVNGIAEAIASTVIGTAVCTALQKTVNREAATARSAA